MRDNVGCLVHQDTDPELFDQAGIFGRVVVAEYAEDANPRITRVYDPSQIAQRAARFIRLAKPVVPCECAQIYPLAFTERDHLVVRTRSRRRLHTCTPINGDHRSRDHRRLFSCGEQKGLRDVLRFT